MRSRPPDDPSWRADALAGSRHSRLLDELRLPAHDPDPERAATLCAELARLALGDFTPALILLPPPLRRRAQALTGYALTLFDFAAQSGLEGERLAQINRWEFELEACLGGARAGQPVFVRMAREEGRRPWDRDALDEIAAVARRRATRPRPATARALTADSDRLGRALATALLEPSAAEVAGEVAGPLLRIAALQRLGADLRRHRAQLPTDELPDDPTAAAPDDGRLAAAIDAEVARLRSSAARRPEVARLPRRLRPAARYVWRAGRALLDRIERLGPRLTRRPPVLGAAHRIALLLRARLGL